jgi:hypothetical protein
LRQECEVRKNFGAARRDGCGLTDFPVRDYFDATVSSAAQGKIAGRKPFAAKMRKKAPQTENKNGKSKKETESNLKTFYLRLAFAPAVRAPAGITFRLEGFYFMP